MKVIHLTDLHLGCNRKVESRAIEQLAEMVREQSPALVLITGDLVEFYDRETFEWASSCVKKLGADVKVVPGNWDCQSGKADGRKLFNEYFGPNYYSFDIDGVHFVGLDSASEGIENKVCHGLDSKQAQWLDDDLKRASKYSDSIVIFTHTHYRLMVTEEQVEFKKIIAKYPVNLYLCGHEHLNGTFTEGFLNCYVTSSALELANRYTDPPSMRVFTIVDGQWQDELLPIEYDDGIRKNAKAVRKVVDDFHIHTKYSGRAQEDMDHDAICKRASEMGLRRVGFTDHLYKHTTYDDIVELRKSFDRISTSGIDAFFGIEIELASYAETTLPLTWRSHFDYILLALDHASGPAMPVPSVFDVKKWIERYQQGFRVACESRVDVLAHPFSGCPEALDAINDDQLIGMLELLMQAGVAIEMNAIKLDRDGGKADYLRLYRLARDMGLLFAVGSDAHTMNEFGRTEKLGRWFEELKIKESMLWWPCKVDRKVMSV